MRASLDFCFTEGVLSFPVDWVDDYFVDPEKITEAVEHSSEYAYFFDRMGEPEIEVCAFDGEGWHRSVVKFDETAEIYYPIKTLKVKH